MGFFNWAAPLVRRFGDRFTDADIALITRKLGDAGPGGRLLDVGGGAGQLSILLAEKLDAHATVLDPTPEMLDHLPDHPRVTGVSGVAEAMPFADDAFDAAIVSDAFHHFRDQPGAAAELQRVVRPGGVVLILELDPSGFFMRFVALVERVLGEPGAFFTPAEMCAFMAEHGIAGECEPAAGATYVYRGVVRAGPADAGVG
ncbi:MAG: methyltransferase domain-containing protein [Anaerosomatales bacterium]|nr:methyltransferase domain-containing protein [Anaerosomatales bacterium]